MRTNLTRVNGQRIVSINHEVQIYYFKKYLNEKIYNIYNNTLIINEREPEVFAIPSSEVSMPFIYYLFHYSCFQIPTSKLMHVNICMSINSID